MHQHVCTKDAPWSKDKGMPARHPDAELLYEAEDYGEQGIVQVYYCPWCDAIFEFVSEPMQTEEK